MTPNDTPSSVDDILGQFCCALGHGAGPIRIRRTVIAALRQRYRGPLAENVDRWESMAPHVLAFMTQVGRLAALFATQQGRSAIGADDFMRARFMVEREVHRHPDHEKALVAGQLCSVIPGEELPELDPADAEMPATVNDPAAPAPALPH